MEISLIEKWSNVTNYSEKFVINDDVIKMAEDQKKTFSYFLKDVRPGCVVPKISFVAQPYQEVTCE